MSATTSTQLLPASQYNEKCSISHESFRDLANQKELVATICGHKFSSLHLLTWLERKTSCPDCRTSLKDTFMAPVALRADDVARRAVAGASASSSSAAAAQAINGDLSAEEALTIALATIQSKSPAEVRRNEANGELLEEEALAIALSKPPEDSLSSEQRANAGHSLEEATRIAIQESTR